MECHSSDSKKLTKVFDASQRKRSKKKRDGFDDTNSVATDDSAIGCLQSNCRDPSQKSSLPEISTAHTTQQEIHLPKRDRDSSPSHAHSPIDGHRSCMRSRRKHRKPVKDGLSLALKAGLNSTPRSGSPPLEGEGIAESIPQDQDSFIYTFLEEAIKRDKKKQRHAKRREERRTSPQREVSPPRRESPEFDYDRERGRERDRGHHKHHHRHREQPSMDREMQTKEISPDLPPINQAALFETFAKMCAQMTEKDSRHRPSSPGTRCQSHKSLQCEVITRKSSYEADRQPVRLKSHSRSRDVVANKIRSQENCSNRIRSHEKVYSSNEMDRCKQEKNLYYYEKDTQKYPSKLEISRSRMRPCEDDRYRDYPPMVAPTRSCIDPYRRPLENRDYRDYDRDSRRHYDDDKRKYCEQKTSRSFEVHREYHDEDRFRRTARSDPKDRRYDERDRRYDDVGKYYDEKSLRSRDRIINSSNKDRRWRKNFERFERISTTSRDDDRDRDRDRFSERERDSGLSVADGDTSTVSGRSNYLKTVKQQISEQRDAMDKMMKLWKELMRCFKGISQTQGKDQNVRESAVNVHESAAEQMRLWWECMRRYETVARDVGDTDARLMEEIKKQRTEMAEMANMWQECLQRYRDISNDFNNLKQQLATPESPTRLPAPPLLCAAEGEGSVAPAAYRLPATYPPHIGPVAVAGIPAGGIPPASIVGGGYVRGMSPPHGRASVPPAWWWNDAPPRSPRRRSSPDSRASRERDKDRRHRHKDRGGFGYGGRNAEGHEILTTCVAIVNTYFKKDPEHLITNDRKDTTRYKEKSSKPSAARSEHRHRKR